MNLVLTEQTLLIALDDEEGRDTAQWGSGAALAAALQLDLGRRDLLRTDEEKKIVAVEGPEPDHELLRDAHATIRASHKRYNAKGWVDRLARGVQTAARPCIARGLVERGILSEERSRMLGVFTRTRFTEVNPVPERELRGRLVDILLTDREPTEEEALLIGLLEPLGLIDRVVPKENRRTARKRAKEIAEYGLAGTAVRDSVREVQAAVMAAAIASTVAAASGGLVVGDSRVSMATTSTLGIRHGRMLALGAAFPLWALTEPRRSPDHRNPRRLRGGVPRVLVERTFHGRASAARPGQASHAADLRVVGSRGHGGPGADRASRGAAAAAPSGRDQGAHCRGRRRRGLVRPCLASPQPRRWGSPHPLTDHCSVLHPRKDGRAPIASSCRG